MICFDKLRFGPILILLPDQLETDAIAGVLAQGMIPFYKTSVKEFPFVKKTYPECTHIIHTIYYEENESDERKWN